MFSHAGALQKLPVIPPAEEIAASALKRSRKVQPAAGIKNEAEKERSRAAKQLDTHMKVRTVGWAIESSRTAAGESSRCSVQLLGLLLGEQPWLMAASSWYACSSAMLHYCITCLH